MISDPIKTGLRGAWLAHPDMRAGARSLRSIAAATVVTLCCGGPVAASSFGFSKVEMRHHGKVAQGYSLFRTKVSGPTRSGDCVTLHADSPFAAGPLLQVKPGWRTLIFRVRDGRPGRIYLRLWHQTDGDGDPTGRFVFRKPRPRRWPGGGWFVRTRIEVGRVRYIQVEGRWREKCGIEEGGWNFQVAPRS